jgi:polar amino acid transport system substrate-binding protein
MSVPVHLGILALVLLVPGTVDGQVLPMPSADAPRTLVVATGEQVPFVVREGDTLKGFSLELLQALAERIGVRVALHDLGPRSELAQIAAVQGGSADLAISAIAITRERESVVDFSLPYFDSGLQIMVSGSGRSYLRLAADTLTSEAILQVLGVGLVLLVLLAHVLWLVERSWNPDFRRGYPRGMGEALWGANLIVATGEYGHPDRSRWLNRLIIGLGWLCGVVFIAQFTATVTSMVTLERLQSEIRGPDDLLGRIIGTAPGGIAAEYLDERGMPHVPIRTPDEGIRMLLGGQVQAIVYEAPTLHYWAARRGSGRLHVVGPLFWPEKYAIAVPLGSPLRKELNRALLGLYRDGSYDAIRRRWFGREG